MCTGLLSIALPTENPLLLSNIPKTTNHKTSMIKKAKANGLIQDSNPLKTVVLLLVMMMMMMTGLLQITKYTLKTSLVK